MGALMTSLAHEEARQALFRIMARIEREGTIPFPRDEVWKNGLRELVPEGPRAAEA